MLKIMFVTCEIRVHVMTGKDRLDPSGNKTRIVDTVTTGNQRVVTDHDFPCCFRGAQRLIQPSHLSRRVLRSYLVVLGLFVVVILKGDVSRTNRSSTPYSSMSKDFW